MLSNKNMLTYTVMPMDEFRNEVANDLRAGSHSHHAIWYLNIKKFRYINESYGYDAGDSILNAFSEYLGNRIASRGICSRIADDRFVVYVSQEFYDSGAASGAFESLYREFNLRLSGLGILQPVEVAAGVYFLTPEDVQEPDVDYIIDKANEAHRRARDQGGNRVIFYDYEYAEKKRRENAIEKDLTQAIAAGEIEVWMQPLIDFVKGEVVASEALARWNHAKLGRLSPAEFIPVLERAGKIGQLDRHIWNVACYEAWNRCQETGEDPVPFSVNVSRAEILDPTLPDYLQGLQEKYQLPEKTLRLEVTESAYTEQPDELVKAVTALRDRGFVVEMDDFGSGYSSLNMLRNLPVDVLKLDMGFLRNENSTASDTVILNSVIRMAHGLDIPIIAEGVETIEQAEMLKTMGCRLMQGYFFAKPMPIEQFYKLLADTKAVKHVYEPNSSSDRMARLLDQKGDTAFFFSHCIGPAFIFSVGVDRYEVVLANDELYGELKLDQEKDNVFNLDMLQRMNIEDRNLFRRATKRAADTGSARCIVRFNEKQNWVECTIRCINADAVGSVFICLVRNATEDGELLCAESVQLTDNGEGSHDKLTGLLTYHSLESIAMGKLGKDGGTLMLVDIDEFDNLKNTLSKNALDSAIDQTANYLRMTLVNDALLARCGKGLFAAFLPGSYDQVQARANACSVIDTLRGAEQREGCKVTCSIGLAMVEEGSDVDLALMYRRALRALTIAKLSGGDGFLLYDTVRDEAASDLEVFGVQLRHAIDGELLPMKALEGADLFNVISRDFEEHHAWNISAKAKRSVRDTVFGALRYRSMAEVPGVLSFDYDAVADCIFLESVNDDGSINQRAIDRFRTRVFEYEDNIAYESLARLSALLDDLEYLPATGNVDLKCAFDGEQEYRWYRFSFTSLRDEKSFVIRGLGYGEDIDLSRESGLWWKDRAMHDGLTGLLNREGIEDAVNMMLAKRGNGIMFIVDIDNFKDINDQLGHLSGDSVLCGLGDTMLAMFRDSDVVGRYGADEMIAFISGLASRDLAHARAQTILDMAKDIEIGNYGNITVSVGVAIIQGKSTFYEFLELADHAVHVAKKHGKNCYTIADEAEEVIEIHRTADSARSIRSDRGKRAMAVEAKYNRERNNPPA